MRLIENQLAPDFIFTDHRGNQSSLYKELSEGPVYLTFLRFASCPHCNLRISKLIERHGKIRQSGVRVISVIESSEKNFACHAGKQEIQFPVILDQKKKLYNLYDLERSWLGILKGFTVKAPQLIEAFSKGFYPGKPDGTFNRMPADFFLRQDGIIDRAYYGSDPGDHLPFDDVMQFGRIQKIMEISPVLQFHTSMDEKIAV